jgi:hypothetical protein
MSPRQAFVSALHLFIVFGVFLAGLLFIALPYLPETRLQMIDLLSKNYDQCTLIGSGFFLFALLLLVGFYALDRGRYLVIEMGISADVKVIRQTVENCFNRQFPKKISLKEVEIGPHSRLELKVDLASLDEAVREELFIQVERELSILFQKRFGYIKPFQLVVRF